MSLWTLTCPVRGRGAIIAALLSLGLGRPALAQEGLVGRVLTEDGVPVGGAIAELLDERLHVLAVARSREDGAFGFPTVPNGAVHVVVRATGFLAWSSELDESGALEVRLRPSRSEGRPATLPPIIFGQIIGPSGEPVAEAEIELNGGTGRTRSDSTGFFALPPPMPREAILVVRRWGYEDRTVMLSRVDTARSLNLSIEMPSAPFELEGLTVEALATLRARQLTGFRLREERWSGVFMDSVALVPRAGVEVIDLLSTIPGVRVQRSGRTALILSRGQRCTPRVWIDGVEVPRSARMDALLSLKAGDLHGVEMYQAGQAPLEFSQGDACMTIVAWRQRVGEGEP